MMTYYVKTTEMCVSILSDGMGKPFSVRAGAGSLWNYYRYKVNESLMKIMHECMDICISPSRKMFKIQIRRMATLKTT